MAPCLEKLNLFKNVNIYEFGKENKRKLLFFQGSCTYWKDYMPSIELLARNFNVIVPAIEGHDPKAKTDFISIEKTVRDTSDYLLEQGHGDIYAVYGLSFGGGMVLSLLAGGRIRFKKAIIDGGITPYELPRWITRLILIKDYLMVMLIRSNLTLFKFFIDPKRWTPKEGGEEKYKSMYLFLKGLSKKSVWNIFDSANNYHLPEPFPKLSTEIQFWYGSNEKKERKRDIKWVLNKIKGVRLKEIPRMEHGELVVMNPQLFYDNAIDFLSL